MSGRSGLISLLMFISGCSIGTAITPGWRAEKQYYECCYKGEDGRCMHYAEKCEKK